MIYQLAIIGGGPAGITAGIYAVRKGLKTLLLTKDFSGQVGRTSEVDNWPGESGVSGMELIKKFEKHLKKFSLEIAVSQEARIIKKEKQAEKPGFFLIKTKSGRQFKAQAVIVATGRIPRRADIKGEEKLIGRGVSFCSVCDGPFFKDKKIAVIGGGNAGFEAAFDLLPYAQRITILEKSPKASADEILRQRAGKYAKIKVILNCDIKEIKGESRVEGLLYQDSQSRKFFEMPVDGVFVEIGSAPVSALVNGLAELNKAGEIKVEPAHCRTSCYGLWAAGDVNDKPYKQIVTAAADGAIAALSVYDYLSH